MNNIRCRIASDFMNRRIIVAPDGKRSFISTVLSMVAVGSGATEATPNAVCTDSSGGTEAEVGTGLGLGKVFFGSVVELRQQWVGLGLGLGLGLLWKRGRAPAAAGRPRVRVRSSLEAW